MPLTSPPPSTGVLLVAHGTRDELGLQQTRSVAQQLSQRLPQATIDVCFLELAEPTIAAGARRLAERGVRRMTVAPLLLLAAGHAKRDIPRAVAEAARDFPELSIRQAPHLGCHPRVLELSARRFAESLKGQEAVADEQTLLLMVGRGSTDPEANAEMARFSRLRFEQQPLGRIEICFTAMARPSLGEALAVVGTMEFARIVVQPHLLFAGELATRVRHEAQQAALRWPAREWLFAEPLGSHPLLVEALAELAASDPPHTPGATHRLAPQLGPCDE